MESRVALDFAKDLFNESSQRLFIEHLVTDDDSTIRSLLSHSNESPRGKLPEEIPTPIFLADPGHRVKVMTKPIFASIKHNKDQMSCKKIDALRLKKYIGCFVSKSHNLPIDDFCRVSKAPVEHLFNCHEWFDPSWCWQKNYQTNCFRRLVIK